MLIDDDGDSWDLTNPIRLVNCIVGRPLFCDLVVVTVYVVTGSKYLHNSFGKVDRQAGSGQPANPEKSVEIP